MTGREEGSVSLFSALLPIFKVTLVMVIGPPEEIRGSMVICPFCEVSPFVSEAFLNTKIPPPVYFAPSPPPKVNLKLGMSRSNCFRFEFVSGLKSNDWSMRLIVVPSLSAKVKLLRHNEE
ncbi:MAG: hypothetical protein IJ144_00460 [Prevotella sp.]|nr:hypothetical protein [Prevotella sp.]MBQ9186278.1 hypothetical protein [Prevotella sp.]